MGKSRPYMKKGMVSHKVWGIVGNYKDLIKKYPRTHVKRYNELGEYYRYMIRNGAKRIKIIRAPSKRHEWAMQIMDLRRRRNPSKVKYYYTQKGKYVPVSPGDMDYKFGETAEEIEKRYKEFLKARRNGK